MAVYAAKILKYRGQLKQAKVPLTTRPMKTMPI